MKTATIILSLIAFATAFSPALAKDKEHSASEAVNSMSDMAECVVNTAGYKAREVLAEAPETDRANKILRSVASARCLAKHDGTVTLSMQPVLWRGALVEAFLKSDFGTLGGVAKRKPAAIFAPLDEGKVKKLGSRKIAILYGLEAALCATQKDGIKVDQLFQTTPGSDEEAQALAAVVPSFASCIPRGRDLSLSKPILRGLLAEAAYRISAAGENSPQLAAVFKPSKTEEGTL